jgi:gluconolactonase
MKMEMVAKGLGFTEGPVVLPDGRVAFCDQFAGGLYIYDGTGVRFFAKTGGSPNGATLGSDGCLYVAQNGGVVGDWHAAQASSPCIQRVHLDGTVETVCTEVAGHALLAPNDICFGPDGRLYFTDPAHTYDPKNRSEDGRIYAVAASGHGELVIRLKPVYNNGLGFRRDGKLMWVESYPREVHLLDNGRNVLVCTLPPNHVPDGFAFAEDGRMFIATVFSHGVTVLGPDGKYLNHVKLADDSCPTNCAFQGNVLWVTDPGDFVNTPGDARLWRVETDAQGLPLGVGSA